MCRMPRGRGSSLSTREKPKVDEAVNSNEDNSRHRRSAYLLLGLLIVFLHGSWSVYRIQFANLPLPLDAEQAGKRGFSEASALEHVKYLTGLGPHPVGSDSLDLAVQVVHVVDTTRMNDGKTEPLSYISLFSNTPGKLTKELVDLTGEEFSCGRNMTIDFVTFTMKYGCWSYKGSNTGGSKLEVLVLCGK